MRRAVEPGFPSEAAKVGNSLPSRADTMSIDAKVPKMSFWSHSVARIISHHRRSPTRLLFLTTAYREVGRSGNWKRIGIVAVRLDVGARSYWRKSIFLSGKTVKRERQSPH